MAIQFFKTHRTWEDWTGMILGVLIGLSPWFADDAVNHAVTLNAVVIGLLVLGLAEFELVELHRWEEGVEIVLGSWLIASPFALGYAAEGTLRFWHFVLGAITVGLAALELWQDWNLSDEKLAEYGK
jgi:hypothetical protein